MMKVELNRDEMEEAIKQFLVYKGIDTTGQDIDISIGRELTTVKMSKKKMDLPSSDEKPEPDSEPFNQE